MEVLRLGCRRTELFPFRDEKTPQTPGQRTALIKATSLWALAQRSWGSACLGNLGSSLYVTIKLGSWNSWDFWRVEQCFRKVFYFTPSLPILQIFWKGVDRPDRDGMGMSSESLWDKVSIRRASTSQAYLTKMPYVRNARKLRWGLWLSRNLCKPCAYSSSRTHTLVPDHPGFESQHCSWVAVWPWASYLICQRLAVFNYTMRTIVPTELDFN